MLVNVVAPAGHQVDRELYERTFSASLPVGLVYSLLICQIIAHDWPVEISIRILPAYLPLWYNVTVLTVETGSALALVVMDCGAPRVFSSGCCETA